MITAWLFGGEFDGQVLELEQDSAPPILKVVPDDSPYIIITYCVYSCNDLGGGCNAIYRFEKEEIDE